MNDLRETDGGDLDLDQSMESSRGKISLIILGHDMEVRGWGEDPL
jgi:hypothetical protein